MFFGSPPVGHAYLLASEAMGTSTGSVRLRLRSPFAAAVDVCLFLPYGRLQVTFCSTLCIDSVCIILMTLTVFLLCSLTNSLRA